jgi:Na+/H+-dicarboxylate symporter
MKITLGFAIGIVLGLVLREHAQYLVPIGDLFMRLLKMLILPLVLCAIISGIANIPDVRKIYKVAVKGFILVVIMTALAIGTGIVFGNLFGPGSGVELVIPTAEAKAVPPVSFVQVFLEMFPNNVFEALSSNNMLQVIVFAVFFGVSLVLTGEKARPVAEFFDKAAQVMYRMVDLVISFAPYGVGALIAGIVGRYGLSALIPLAKFLIVFHVAVAFFVVIIQGGLIAIGFKMNPFTFFKAIFGSIAMAYVTDSSAAALPVAIKELQSNLGVSESIASFVMPVGTNISKSGSALYQGMVAIFIAQLMNVDLTLPQQITVLVTALLAAIGTAGVPSASIVMLSMTLGSVGLPLEGIALMVGIDRILAGARTFPNVVTNAAIAAIMARQENELHPVAAPNGATSAHA